MKNEKVKTRVLDKDIIGYMYEGGNVHYPVDEKLRILIESRIPYNITKIAEFSKDANGTITGAAVKATLTIGHNTYEALRFCDYDKHGPDFLALADTFATGRALSFFLGLSPTSQDEMDLIPEPVQEDKPVEKTKERPPVNLTGSVTNLANEKISITKPVEVPAEKNDIPVEQPINTGVFKYTEQQLTDMGTKQEIWDVCEEYGIYPRELPVSKVTNKLVRTLILKYQEGVLNDWILKEYGKETFNFYMQRVEEFNNIPDEAEVLHEEVSKDEIEIPATSISPEPEDKEPEDGLPVEETDEDTPTEVFGDTEGEDFFKSYPDEEIRSLIDSLPDFDETGTRANVQDFTEIGQVYDMLDAKCGGEFNKLKFIAEKFSDREFEHFDELIMEGSKDTLLQVALHKR